jgi:hypothetical protein
VAALRDLETLQPAEMQGLLHVVAGSPAPVPRNGRQGDSLARGKEE